MLVFVGEVGIGKSVLFDVMVVVVCDYGMCVLWVMGLVVEVEVLFGGLLELLCFVLVYFDVIFEL